MRTISPLDNPFSLDAGEIILYEARPDAGLLVYVSHFTAILGCMGAIYVCYSLREIILANIAGLYDGWGVKVLSKPSFEYGVLALAIVSFTVLVQVMARFFHGYMLRQRYLITNQRCIILREASLRTKLYYFYQKVTCLPYSDLTGVSLRPLFLVKGLCSVVCIPNGKCAVSLLSCIMQGLKTEDARQMVMIIKEQLARHNNVTVR